MVLTPDIIRNSEKKAQIPYIPSFSFKKTFDVINLSDHNP